MSRMSPKVIFRHKFPGGLGPALTPRLKNSGPPLQYDGPFVWLWPVDQGIEAAGQFQAFRASPFEPAAQISMPTFVRPSSQGLEEQCTYPSSGFAILPCIAA
jgi:hypothetical protein